MQELEQVVLALVQGQQAGEEGLVLRAQLKHPQAQS